MKELITKLEDLARCRNNPIGDALTEAATKLKEITDVVTDYLRSEGCKCCESMEHAENRRRLEEVFGDSLYRRVKP